MSNFWDWIQLIVSTFVLAAFLFVLFQIIGDLFQDTELGSLAKVLWLIGLIFLPALTAIVYIIARGRGMAQRRSASQQSAKSEMDTYIRKVARKSHAEQIADAKALLDAGTINEEEFARLKVKALS